MKLMWQQLYRVGYLGRRRDQKIVEWNKSFGIGNWKLGHKFNQLILDFNQVCKIYEDAYFQFMWRNPTITNHLRTLASDVYDNVETNVNSKLDYSIQEAYSNHIQDIAVRNVFLRLGLDFLGNRLVQIRSTSKDDVGRVLTPGRVPFHLPRLIEEPQIKGWWELNSVESFYQSNKYLYKRIEND